VLHGFGVRPRMIRLATPGWPLQFYPIQTRPRGPRSIGIGAFEVWAVAGMLTAAANAGRYVRPEIPLSRQRVTTRRPPPASA